MRHLLVGTETNGLIAAETLLVVVAGVSTPAKKISERTRLCECRTSFYGDVLDDWQVFETPWGLWERHYWARGGGLERSGVDWRAIGSEEIAEKAATASRLAREAEAAASALKALVPS